MQTPEGITVIPTSFDDVVRILGCDALAAVEQPIAGNCRYKIFYDGGAASRSYMQAEISVSGMTVSQIEAYLIGHRDSIIAFASRCLLASADDEHEQEYPEGEEQDPDGESVTLGLANGFGISHAINHNFLANRPMPEFHAFLKNRRTPKHTKVAKELLRVFRSTIAG